MVNALYLDDCYLKEFESKVKTVTDGKFVILEESAFYPNSGGQANDTGIIIRKSDNKEFKVVFVGKFNGQISHEIEGDGLLANEEVVCEIDWERRYKLMRMHSASHVLSGVIHKDDKAMITGNQLNTDKSRIDFSLENYSAEKLQYYINQTNKIIDKNIPIEIYYMNKDEDPEQFLRLAKGLPPNLERIRIVDIVGFDKQPDGGTHVKNTSEIGHLEFIKGENKGSGRRRVYFRLV